MKIVAARPKILIIVPKAPQYPVEDCITVEDLEQDFRSELASPIFVDLLLKEHYKPEIGKLFSNAI